MTSFEFFTKDEQNKFTVPFDDAEEKLLGVLDEFGVAIVTDVLNEASCHTLEEIFAKDLMETVDKCRITSEQKEDIVRLRKSGRIRDAPASLISSLMGKKGRLSGRGLPQGQFAWESRLHPRVRKLFSILYRGAPVESLATGLDNPFFSPFDAQAQSTNREWLHVDQNVNTGLLWKCYQGVLYIWGSEDEGASTTVLWPGSHKEEIYSRVAGDEYSKRRGVNSWGQLVELNKLQGKDGREVHRLSLEGSRRAAMPAGSLLVWDSRTVHQGWQSGRRLAMPVCLEPRGRRGEDALMRKLWLCAAGLPSSHSSSEGRVHGMSYFSKKPSCLEGDDDNIPLKPLMVPWCVKPDMEDEWEWLYGMELWTKGKNARENADKAGDYKANIEGILRQEVLDCL